MTFSFVNPWGSQHCTNQIILFFFKIGAIAIRIWVKIPESKVWKDENRALSVRATTFWYLIWYSTCKNSLTTRCQCSAVWLSRRNLAGTSFPFSNHFDDRIADNTLVSEARPAWYSHNYFWLHRIKWADITYWHWFTLFALSKSIT